MKQINKNHYVGWFNNLAEIFNGVLRMRRSKHQPFTPKEIVGKAFTLNGEPVAHVKGEGTLHPILPPHVDYDGHDAEFWHRKVSPILFTFHSPYMDKKVYVPLWLIALISAYAIEVFFTLEPDPTTWTHNQRFCMVLEMFMLLVILIVAKYHSTSR